MCIDLADWADFWFYLTFGLLDSQGYYTVSCVSVLNVNIQKYMYVYFTRRRHTLVWCMIFCVCFRDVMMTKMMDILQMDTMGSYSSNFSLVKSILLTGCWYWLWKFVQLVTFFLKGNTMGFDSQSISCDFAMRYEFLLWLVDIHYCIVGCVGNWV